MPSRLLLLPIVCFVAHAADFWVSPQGKDANSGTKARPFATFVAAQRAVAQRKGSGPVTVHFLAGTYYLPQTVVFTDKDSGSKDSPITYMADEGVEAVISGGTRLSLQWKPWRGEIMQARVPAGMESDQLFVNGERQRMARYPNFDPDRAVFRRVGGRRVQQGTRRALGRSERRLHPRDASPHVGRLPLRDHRERRRRKCQIRGRVAEQPPDGHARQVPVRRKHLRGAGRARRMVFGPEDVHALFLSAEGARLAACDRRGCPFAALNRVSRDGRAAREVGQFERSHVPPCGAHLYGQ